jgi:hypothetical protein
MSPIVLRELEEINIKHILDVIDRFSLEFSQIFLAVNLNITEFLSDLFTFLFATRPLSFNAAKQCI